MNKTVFIKNNIINITELQQIVSVLKVFSGLLWAPLAGWRARHA
jgi:hypothetical protein